MGFSPESPMLPAEPRLEVTVPAAPSPRLAGRRGLTGPWLVDALLRGWAAGPAGREQKNP